MSQGPSHPAVNTTNQHYHEQLYALLQVTRAINNNIPASDLFSIYEYILQQQLGFSKFAYCHNEGLWKWPVCLNSAFEVLAVNPSEDLNGFLEMTFLNESNLGERTGFDIVIPVLHKDKPLAYLLIGNENPETLPDVRMQDLEFVQTISNVIAVAIENKRLFKESIEQEMYRRELEMAKEVQTMLIPSSLPLDEHFDFAAFYQPMRQIGGDYYDFIRLNEEEVIFCVADVSGKGVAAALLMANFQAYLRAMVSVSSDLEQLVIDLNDRVVQSAKGEKFITLFIAKYNHQTRLLHYINAGHNPPVLCSESGIDILKLGTTGLGMLEKLFRLEAGSCYIKPDSMLLCYTDGLVEQEDEGGKDFGIEHLEELLLQNRGISSTTFNELLVSHLKTYKGDLPFIDDIALLTCKFF
jgi:sigma-B regulation protein RsbU (phosphoserine phosphatase)